MRLKMVRVTGEMEGGDSVNRKKKRYRWDAEEYARHSSAQQIWARELITKLQLRGNESILDIGCGDGKITAEIAAQLSGGNTLGVDNSPEMLALARKYFPRESHPKLSFELADANNLLFEEQFDMIFSNATLHWIKDHRPVMRGIQNSLKPGGNLFLQMGGRGNAETIISVLDAIRIEKKWKHYFANFTFPYGFYEPERYTQLLKEANLVPVRVELLPKTMSYQNRDGLAGWIRTTWLSYIDRIPVHRKDEFISQIVDTYIKEFPPNNNGAVCVEMVRLEVEAEKRL